MWSRQRRRCACRARVRLLTKPSFSTTRRDGCSRPDVHLHPVQFTRAERVVDRERHRGRDHPATGHPGVAPSSRRTRSRTPAGRCCPRSGARPAAPARPRAGRPRTASPRRYAPNAAGRRARTGSAAGEFVSSQLPGRCDSQGASQARFARRTADQAVASDRRYGRSTTGPSISITGHPGTRPNQLTAPTSRPRPGRRPTRAGSPPSVQQHTSTVEPAAAVVTRSPSTISPFASANPERV